jgi:hypothetical protein
MHLRGQGSPSKPEKMVTAMFNSFIIVVLGDGNSARFWSDSWLPDGPIVSFAPHLHRAIGRRYLRVTI